MPAETRTRRRFLAALTIPAVGAAAGCQVDISVGSTPTPEPLDAVRHERVYVADSLSLSTPDGVYSAASPGEADVVVVPGDTDRSNATIVDWLAADRYVAFVGGAAQDTWHAVQRSDAYAATFGAPQAMASSCASSSAGGGGGSGGGGSGGGGSGDADGSPEDCEPPDVLVAWRLEDVSTTYGKTWANTDDPSSRQVFEAIDEALEDDA